MLCIAAGMACLGSGDGDGAAAWVKFAEHALDRLGDAAEPLDRALFATFRAMVRRDAVAVSLSDAATGVRDLPPGTWHAAACLIHGSLSWMAGDFERACAMLTQAAAEARASQAPSLEAMTRARLALVHLSRGELRDAHRQAADARALQRAHLLDEMPTLHVVPAVTALLAVRNGEVDVAQAEARLSRRNLSYFDGVAPWVSVPTRLVLAETALLLGERATASQLLDEARALLDVATDATHAASRCDVLTDRLRETGGSLAAGRFALTTAELRVLHYLPTNLHLQEIASRLYLSRWTVKSHASSIYRKLGARNRAHAVTLAREAGLLAGDESTA
jgi:LuxR family maltose regulon positive regulatory protein